MTKHLFVTKLVEWYNANGRSLPWRETSDPYKIWVSEIILQQTRVAQGLPYYKRFVQRFRTIKSLASAPETEVLRYWQGLGYYSRARNLHKGALKIVNDFKGKFPSTYQTLLEVPGIGPYTAAAISSICFKEQQAVVDGNVIRVLARFFGIYEDALSHHGKKLFSEKANALIPSDNPDTFNQAIMEFGALQCTPGNPDCDVCPFNRACYAKRKEVQDQLPVKKKKQPLRHRYLYYFVFHTGGKILMRQRKIRDIWQGLYEFYLLESPEVKTVKQILRKDPLAAKFYKPSQAKIYPPIRHVLSHQVLHVSFIYIKIKSGEKLFSTHPEYLFYDSKAIKKLPKPVPIVQFIEKKLNLS